MSILTRDRYRKKLHHLLSMANDEAFVKLAWAVDALQSGRRDAAASHIHFPIEAATSDMGSNFKIHPWELETLIGQLLVVAKKKPGNSRNRIVDCKRFASCGIAVNLLRKLEDAEAGLYLDRFRGLNEMHRIAQRQLPWQRGYFNVVQFYRYAYIYGQGQCERYFQQTYGLSMNEFSLIGFGLHAGFQGRPWLNRQYSLEELGISSRIFEAGLRLLSNTIAQARESATSTIEHPNSNFDKPLPTAYRPSFLRRVPVISFGGNDGRLFAPLPELILLRITSGIYYDLATGPANLRNEASMRFEDYSAAYIAAMLPGFNVARSNKYRFQGNLVDAPDILVKRRARSRSL